jgi:hypothetical protein
MIRVVNKIKETLSESICKLKPSGGDGPGEHRDRVCLESLLKGRKDWNSFGVNGINFPVANLVFKYFLGTCWIVLVLSGLLRFNSHLFQGSLKDK